MKKGAAFQIASLVFLYVISCPWHPVAVLAAFRRLLCCFHCLQCASLHFASRGVY